MNEMTTESSSSSTTKADTKEDSTKANEKENTTKDGGKNGAASKKQQESSVQIDDLSMQNDALSLQQQENDAPSASTLDGNLTSITSDGNLAPTSTSGGNEISSQRPVDDVDDGDGSTASRNRMTNDKEAQILATFCDLYDTGVEGIKDKNLAFRLSIGQGPFETELLNLPANLAHAPMRQFVIDKLCGVATAFIRQPPDSKRRKAIALATLGDADETRDPRLSKDKLGRKRLDLFMPRTVMLGGKERKTLFIDGLLQPAVDTMFPLCIGGLTKFGLVHSEATKLSNRVLHGLASEMKNAGIASNAEGVLYLLRASGSDTSNGHTSRYHRSSIDAIQQNQSADAANAVRNTAASTENANDDPRTITPVPSTASPTADRVRDIMKQMTEGGFEDASDLAVWKALDDNKDDTAWNLVRTSKDNDTAIKCLKKMFDEDGGYRVAASNNGSSVAGRGTSSLRQRRLGDGITGQQKRDAKKKQKIPPSAAATASTFYKNGQQLKGTLVDRIEGKNLALYEEEGTGNTCWVLDLDSMKRYEVVNSLPDPNRQEFREQEDEDDAEFPDLDGAELLTVPYYDPIVEEHDAMRGFVVGHAPEKGRYLFRCKDGRLYLLNLKLDGGTNQAVENESDCAAAAAAAAVEAVVTDRRVYE